MNIDTNNLNVTTTRPMLSGSYSLSATGYLRTVAGDATPFMVQAKLKDSRLKKAHEIERDGLFNEIENLTRQRSELLSRAHDQESMLQREKARRKRAESRLKDLRARSSEAISSLVAKQEAVMKELEKANKLLNVMSPVIYSNTENTNETNHYKDQHTSQDHPEPDVRRPSTQDSTRRNGHQFRNARPQSANVAVGSGTRAALFRSKSSNLSTLDKDKQALIRKASQLRS